jgi:hypothetical protein
MPNISLPQQNIPHYIWQDEGGWHIRLNKTNNQTFNGTIISGNSIQSISVSECHLNYTLNQNRTQISLISCHPQNDVAIDLKNNDGTLIFDIFPSNVSLIP